MDMEVRDLRRDDWPVVEELFERAGFNAITPLGQSRPIYRLKLGSERPSERRKR